jgi:hypothetical protein
MTHDVPRKKTIGFLIGAAGGMLNFFTVIFGIGVYGEFFAPGDGMGQTFFWAPIFFCAPVFLLGLILAWIAGRTRFRCDGPLRGLLFGAAVMACSGILWTLILTAGIPSARSPLTLVIDTCVVCPILSGMVGGAIVGWIFRRRA